MAPNWDLLVLVTFHDLRKTAISNWFEGLKECGVMTLAGHADFKTTHTFYLAIADDLGDRARQATVRGLCQKLVRHVTSPKIKTGKQP